MSQATQMLEDVSVPNINELRVLKMMRTTKTKPLARFALASLALVRLHHRIGNGSRSALFAPITSVKETKPIITEGKASAWQIAFLDRLEEEGLVQFNDGIYSVPLDRRTDLARLAAAPFNSDVMELKRRLWPGDYAESDDPAEATEIVHVEPPDGESQVLHDLTGALTTLVQTMQATLASVAPINASMAELEKRIGAKVDQVQKAVTSVEKVAASFNEASSRYDNLIRILEDEDRRNLTLIAEKISELSGRAKSVSNQLDAVVSKESDLIGELKGLLERREL